ncbi:hypothetical protein [Olleya sp. HaHaR_3_96]|uniref:hypothetical protein n=1 Tax=Olleya sp. HaHaR_3_96 TaxID=2745560 RepID=UPI001C4F7654|nr:hypothetical protein [Olleya sp. HaHaR_3_96]QXP60828.1 hypothetical protein H0I26_04095 [Olleya sp. HaHaR_3_96]
MKKLVLTLAFICICVVAFAQNQPTVGDALVVQTPSGESYNHIDFPRLNILVKRGKLASYSPVIDNTVIVEEVITKDNATYVIIKKKDGTKFFGFQASAEVNYEKALASGELTVVTP